MGKKRRSPDDNLLYLKHNTYKASHSKRSKSRWTLLKALSQISLKSYFIIFLALLVIFWGYWFSPLGRVAKISVSGVNYLGEQQIIDATKINSNSSVLLTLLQQRQLKRQIKTQVPLVKQVSFRFSNFNQLKISVTEYQTVGFVIKNDGYFRVLENNQIIKPKLQQPIGSFPVYQTFGPHTSLKQIIHLYLSLAPKLRNDISEIHGSPRKSLYPYRLKLYMNDGNCVIGDIRTLKTKLRYYPAIASRMSEKGVVNLELGAYSRPK